MRTYSYKNNLSLKEGLISNVSVEICINLKYIINRNCKSVFNTFVILK